MEKSHEKTHFLKQICCLMSLIRKLQKIALTPTRVSSCRMSKTSSETGMNNYTWRKDNCSRIVQRNFQRWKELSWIFSHLAHKFEQNVIFSDANFPWLLNNLTNATFYDFENIVIPFSMKIYIFWESAPKNKKRKSRFFKRLLCHCLPSLPQGLQVLPDTLQPIHSTVCFLQPVHVTLVPSLRLQPFLLH